MVCDGVVMDDGRRRERTRERDGDAKERMRGFSVEIEVCCVII